MSVKEIEETNYLVGHENPQFLDPLGDIPQPLSEQEQFNLDKTSHLTKANLAHTGNKRSHG